MNQQFKWSKFRPTKGLSYPTSREGHTLTFIQKHNQIIMFGGISNGRLNDIMIYNLQDQSWKVQETKGRQPSPRCYHVAFYDEECDCLFFYGGQGDKGRSLSDFYILNLSNWNWKRLFLLDVPQSRHHHTMNDLNNFEREKIIFGGACLPENHLLNDVWIFNYKQVVFTSTLPEIPGAQCVLKQTKGEGPTPRKGHSSVMYKNSLYIIGGKTESQESSDIFSLGVDNWTWKKIQSIGKPPSPRAFFACSLFATDKILLFGGLDNSSNKILNETYMFQLADNYWSAPFTAGQMPQARYHMGYCLIDASHFMVIGGIETSYCSMDLFMLEEGAQVKEAVMWEQIKEPTQLERETSEKAGMQIIEGKRYLQELEEAMIYERNKQSQISKELKMVTQEWENLDHYCSQMTQQIEGAYRDAETAQNNKQLAIETIFMMIKQEQMISKEIQIKSKMLEDVLQRIHDYMIFLDQFYSAVKRNKLDENDPREVKLKRLSDAFNDDYLKAKDTHKEQLFMVKQIYEKYLTLQKKVEKDLDKKRKEIFHSNKEYEALLFDTENDI